MPYENLDQMMDYIKNLKFFTVEIPFDEDGGGIRFKGPAIYDMKIDKGVITFYNVPGTDYEDAELKARNTVNISN